MAAVATQVLRGWDWRQGRHAAPQQLADARATALVQLLHNIQHRQGQHVYTYNTVKATRSSAAALTRENKPIPSLAQGTVRTAVNMAD